MTTAGRSASEEARAAIAGRAADDLDAAVRAADPSARLVSPRILRRLIARDLELGPLHFRVPHRDGLVLEGRRALELAEPDEIGLGADEAPPASLALIARPADESPGAALREAWRRLFRARVRDAAARAAADIDGARRRIDRIGREDFEDARGVLRDDDALLDPDDDREAYAEFASRFLDRYLFDRPGLAVDFPFLHDPAAVAAALADDVDARSLKARTRPEGADDAAPVDPGPESEPEAVEAVDDGLFGHDLDGSGLLDLRRRAAAASAKGNCVRAAILKARAAAKQGPPQAERARASARTDLNALARRLHAALDLDDAGASGWRRALHALLGPAARGLWPPAARLLYDLQAACLDHERDVFATDLFGWAVSLGRRPLTRRLPFGRETRMLRHLRSASGRLDAARLAPADRERLARLIRRAIGQTEARLRERLRPGIVGAFDGAGLLPANLPEEVSREATIESLLDRAVERGLLTLGDVRDALSRGHLKLADLSGPEELVAGDRLLDADRRLAAALEGIYRRGEVYLRSLQRFSAVAFGTRAGRFVAKYLALPLGLGYAIPVAVQEIHHLTMLGVEYVVPSIHHREWHLTTPGVVLGLSALAFGLIHSKGFRGLVRWSLRLLVQPVRLALIDAPAWALNHPRVRAILAGRPFALAMRLAVKPAAGAAAAWLLLDALGSTAVGARNAALVAGTVALAALNTRAGRAAEEQVFGSLLRGWHHLARELAPGLVRAVASWFDRALERFERILYAVDEYLRFRAGQGRLVLGVKAALGAIWAAFQYIIRIYVNLLIEPQINPIKHFPTVTVAAKLILPLIPTLTHVIATPLMPLAGKWLAYGFAGVTVFFLPGVAGFLMWELKENWRLYAANRPAGLGPAAVGHHGETVLRLLRPGFHSGTLPKLHRRLRRAAGAGEPGTVRGRRSARKARATLHHDEEALRRLVERDFLAYLRRSRSFRDRPVALGALVAGPRRIAFDLHVGRGDGSPPARLAFAVRGGFLVARVERAGPLDALDEPARRAFALALGGLDKAAAVQLVGEQLRRLLGPDDPRPTARGLEARPGVGPLVVYDLSQEPLMIPRSPDGAPPIATALAPTLAATEVRYDRATLAWDRWVAFWDDERAGRPLPDSPVPGFTLLPEPGEGVR